MPLFGSKKKADGGDAIVAGGGIAGDNDAAEVFSMRGREAARRWCVRFFFFRDIEKGNALIPIAIGIESTRAE